MFYIASLMVFALSLYNVADNKNCHLPNVTHSEVSTLKLHFFVSYTFNYILITLDMLHTVVYKIYNLGAEKL